MAGKVVLRNNARTRWLHAGVYVTVLALLYTGWWLTLGHEGDPSVLSRVLDLPDPQIHTDIGWVFTGVCGVGIVFGRRGARTLLVDSVRFRRADLRWFAALPAAIFTGRFRRHEGHFDPGQRIANILMIVLMLALIISGIALTSVSGGPAFVRWHKVHTWATYAFTAVAAVHILVATGILPGYRGVWRAMHFGGRLRVTVAERLWPGWLQRQQADDRPVSPASAVGSRDDDPGSR